MNCTLDSHKLATMVQGQRAGRPLREVADELGDVSASTLCRLEAGKWPDMHVFLSICRWLKVSPEQFFYPIADSIPAGELNPVTYSQGQIIDLIRSDATLAPVTANVLTALVKGAYQLKQ